MKDDWISGYEDLQIQRSPHRNASHERLHCSTSVVLISRAAFDVPLAGIRVAGQNKSFSLLRIARNPAGINSISPHIIYYIPVSARIVVLCPPVLALYR